MFTIWIRRKSEAASNLTVVLSQHVSRPYFGQLSYWIEYMYKPHMCTER